MTLQHFAKTVNKRIEPGWQGIFATCDKGRESRCVAELYQLFDTVSLLDMRYFVSFGHGTRQTHIPQYADKLYGPVEAGQRPEDLDEEDEDIETVLAAEVKDINSSESKQAKRFTSIKVDTPCGECQSSNRFLKPLSAHIICCNGPLHSLG
jgi:tRNA acetyltransferase TAN1